MTLDLEAMKASWLKAVANGEAEGFSRLFVPDILAAVEALQGENKRMREALERIADSDPIHERTREWLIHFAQEFVDASPAPKRKFDFQGGSNPSVQPTQEKVCEKCDGAAVGPGVHTAECPVAPASPAPKEDR